MKEISLLAGDCDGQHHLKLIHLQMHATLFSYWKLSNETFSAVICV